MSDKPKPGGYYDRTALAHAISGNRELIELVGELSSDRPPSEYRAILVLQRMALRLAEQRDALAEMEQIRLCR